MISRISVSAKPILKEMLNCPYSLQYLSENGRQPADPEQRGRHDDGCGMAFSKDGSVEVHRRSKQDAWDDSYVALARSVSTHGFIAHNRLVSKGLEANEDGAHPFIISVKGKSFALCHNGGIKDFMDEARQQRTSDSLIFLRQLISTSENNDASSILKRLQLVKDQTSYSSLCAFLLSDNELYAWRIYSDNDRANKDAYEKYYTLYLSMRDHSALLSSEPLDDQPWMLLQNNSFLHLERNDDRIAINYSRIS